MSDVTVTSLVNLQRSALWRRPHLHHRRTRLRGRRRCRSDPYVLILSALGSCISMTTTLYARRKGWPLEKVTVHYVIREFMFVIAPSVPGLKKVTYIASSEQFLTGPLAAEQQTRLQEIAHKCPVHKTLTSEIVIAELKDDGSQEVRVRSQGSGVRRGDRGKRGSVKMQRVRDGDTKRAGLSNSASPCL